MLRKRSIWLSSAVVFFLALPARAQESPLAVVPGQAALVVQLHGIERTKERVMALLKNAVPDLAPTLQTKLDEALKGGLQDQGRELKGLPADGPIFLVLLQLPKSAEEFRDPPASYFAFVVRVTDYKTFRDGILKEDERKNLKSDPAGFDVVKTEGDQELHFIDRKGYAAVTLTKETAELFTKPKEGLDRKLTKEQADQFLKSDVSVYVDMAAVKKEYSEQIAQGRQRIEQLAQLAEGGGGLGKDAMQMAKKGLDALFQALEDSRSAVAGVNLEPQGLGLSIQLQVGPETKTNTFLKAFKPQAIEGLASLPTGHMFYTAVRYDAELLKLLGPLMRGVAPDAETEKGKAIKEIFDALAAAGPKLSLAAQGARQEGLTVSHYDDAAKATEAQLKLFQTAKEGETWQFIPIKKAEIKPNDKTHRDFKLHYAKLEWDLDKMLESVTVPQAAEGIKKNLGEGLQSWFGTDGKVLVQISAKDWDTAKGHLDKYLDKKSILGQQGTFTITRKNLPTESTMVAVIDLPQYLQSVVEQVQALGLPLGDGAAPAQGEPPYLGAALTLQAESGRVDLFIPASAAAEFRRVFEPILRMFGAFGGN